MVYQTVLKGNFVASDQGPAPRKATSEDLCWIQTWVENYEIDPEYEDDEFLEKLHVCQEWLEKQIQIKYRQEMMVQAKKKYAAENNVSYKNVRVMKQGGNK
jgi:hypothetical protein